VHIKRKHLLRTQCLRKSFNHLRRDYEHVLEFGVAKGITTEVISRYLANHYDLFGFDSFYGLPEDWMEDGKLMSEKGRCSRNGIPPLVKSITFFIGWFEETIPLYLKRAKPIALLHIDSDLYSSAKTVLYSLNSYILKGSYSV